MRIRARWLDWTLAVIVVALCWLLFRTLRVRYIAAGGTNPFDRQTSEGFIYCVWHDMITFPLFVGRHERTVALVSGHQDGSHLAAGLRLLGIGLVRGSTSRSGAGAMRQLLRLPKNTRVVLTPDGPRGPRRQIKGGLIFLAMHADRAIVPTAFAARRSWKIPGSWTDLTIPKPFTVVYALSGPAIRVAPNASPEDLAAAQVMLQAQMDSLASQAEQLMAGIPAERCLADDRAAAA